MFHFVLFLLMRWEVKKGSVNVCRYGMMYDIVIVLENVSVKEK
jgi:hypothetical protein